MNSPGGTTEKAKERRDKMKLKAALIVLYPVAELLWLPLKVEDIIFPRREYRTGITAKVESAGIAVDNFRASLYRRLKKLEVDG